MFWKSALYTAFEILLYVIDESGAPIGRFGKNIQFQIDSWRWIRYLQRSALLHFPHQPFIFFFFIALRSRNFTDQYIKHIFYLFQEGVPVLIVVIIGVVLLLLNVCACAAVIYQKHRVRQREDNLQRRIKRLSDAGLVMRPSNNDQTASTVSNNDLETTSR